MLYVLLTDINRIKLLTYNMTKTLAELKVGESAVIHSLAESELQTSLMEMGLLPGVKVQLLHIAPFGDPIAVLVEDYQLSLRKAEAALVLLAVK